LPSPEAGVSDGHSKKSSGVLRGSAPPSRTKVSAFRQCIPPPDAVIFNNSAGYGQNRLVSRGYTAAEISGAVAPNHRAAIYGEYAFFVRADSASHVG
jgi:hypothetical protein